MSSKTTNTEITAIEAEVIIKQATVLKEAKVQSTVVYLGATILMVAKSNTIFNNGITKDFQSKVETNPWLRGLLVPIEGLTTAKKELRIKDSALSILYAKSEKLS